MDLVKQGLQWVKKYRYAVLVILVGIVLMALPSLDVGEKDDRQTKTEYTLQQDPAAELESILCQIRGVGKVKVLLRLEEGERIIYQYDEQGDRKQTVIVTGQDRVEQGLICEVVPARYGGAVIVCQGGGDPAVQLQIIDAVSKLTGLRSDRISVLKMK